MYNCIFSGFCVEPSCDQSCPILAQTSYLMDRNNLSIKSLVLRANSKDLDKCNKHLDMFDGKLSTYLSHDTAVDADLLTYCAICRNWRGSQLHCTVYNLKFSKFLDDTKQSWSKKSDPESLEYIRIWSESAKVLIISNIDFVNFGDFESQTLLNIIQSRRELGKSTIIVTPPIGQLVNKPGSVFFDRLHSILQGCVSEARKVVS